MSKIYKELSLITYAEKNFHRGEFDCFIKVLSEKMLRNMWTNRYTINTCFMLRTNLYRIGFLE